MPTSTDIRVISLGTHADLDTNENTTGAEGASSLIGTTFGSAGDPLAYHITPVTLYDGNDNGTIPFDGPGGNPANEWITVDGTNYYLDTGVLYLGTVTYLDGTSATNVPLRVLQDTDGNLMLIPPPVGASALEIQALTTAPIQSIQITSVEQNDFGRLISDRYGLVDGPVFVCFCKGTLIRTERGEIPVEDLRVGDMVITRDHGPQSLRWVGSKHVGAAVLQCFDRLRPVRIAAGALGENLPQRPLYLSQQHRVLISSKIAERIFGETEVLIAAKHLTEIDGIEIDNSLEAVEYFHLLFDRHEIINSEGAQTESLFTGPEALKSVDPAARTEILALFPDLLTEDHAFEAARPFGDGRRGRQLAKRHAGNHRELQSALTR